MFYQAIPARCEVGRAISTKMQCRRKPRVLVSWWPLLILVHVCLEHAAAIAELEHDQAKKRREH